MNRIAISVNNISKQYKLGITGYGTLRDDFISFVAHLRGKEDPNSLVGGYRKGPIGDYIFALKDVSIDIPKGGAIGIVGSNGSGKSTLLKVMSRITAPTTGEVRINGKVGCLLEVGTGFHPDLTGRENVYLNGAILGMRKNEIDQRFDEIIDFSGIEKFIDTPVKRYSSGMYVRLGFSVAAHLEPDILMVDEVLAVGDFDFQKKCLIKMNELASKDGKTIIFVSHNMAAVSSFCKQCIYLDSGNLIQFGSTPETIKKYYDSKSTNLPSEKKFEFDQVGDEFVQLLEGSIEDNLGRKVSSISLDKEIFINMRFSVKQNIHGNCIPLIHLYTKDYIIIFISESIGYSGLKIGTYETKCKIPSRLLNEGTYIIGLAVRLKFAAGYKIGFYEQFALSIKTVEFHGKNSNRYGFSGIYPGFIKPELEWTLKKCF